MNDPLKPLKESIKQVPIMKYALAVVGLASAASMAFAYFKSMKYGIIAMSVVLVFMILIILITNIPKIKHIQVYVSAFLIFILLSIFTVSGRFIWTLIKTPDGISQMIIDVEDSNGESVKQGVVRLKITSVPEIMSEISKGIVSFPINNLRESADSATIIVEEKAYDKYIERVSVNDLLEHTYKITLQKKGVSSVDVVFKMDGQFCDDLKTKLFALKLKTTQQHSHVFNLKTSYSGSIESIKDNLYKYPGGYLIIEVNGKQVSFENKIIEPIDVYYGSPKLQIEKQLNNALKKLTCSFTRDDVNKIVETL